MISLDAAETEKQCLAAIRADIARDACGALPPGIAQACSRMKSDANVAIALPPDFKLPLDDATRIWRTG